MNLDNIWTLYILELNSLNLQKLFLIYICNFILFEHKLFFSVQVPFYILIYCSLCVLYHQMPYFSYSVMGTKRERKIERERGKGYPPGSSDHFCAFCHAKMSANTRLRERYRGRERESEGGISRPCTKSASAAQGFPEEFAALHSAARTLQNCVQSKSARVQYSLSLSLWQCASRRQLCTLSRTLAVPARLA